MPTLPVCPPHRLIAKKLYFARFGTVPWGNQHLAWGGVLIKEPSLQPQKPQCLNRGSCNFYGPCRGTHLFLPTSWVCDLTGETSLFKNFEPAETDCRSGHQTTPTPEAVCPRVRELFLSTITSPTTAVAQLSLSASTAGGVRSVTGSDGVHTATATNLFVVTGASILSITPNTATQGQTGVNVSVTGQGTHFNNGSTLDVGAGITVSSLVATDATHLNAQLNISAQATAGQKDVAVVTLTEVALLKSGFTITSGNQAPVVRVATKPFKKLSMCSCRTTIMRAAASSATAARRASSFNRSSQPARCSIL